MIHFHINHWYGRFGNNIIAICNGIYTARKYKGKLTFMPHPILKQKIFDFTEGDITELYQENFYEFNKHFTEILSVTDLHELIHVYLMDIIPRLNIELSEKDLIIHIRSGDIFLPQYYDFNYTQPPLSYYTNIIDNNKYDHIYLVAEDYRNPVINELLKYNAHIKTIIGKNNNTTVLNFNYEFIRDLNILLQAKNLVVGTGSLGYIVALMSNKLIKLYNCTPPKISPQWDMDNLKTVIKAEITTTDLTTYYAEIKNAS
jgi:hypothetical protein